MIMFNFIAELVCSDTGLREIRLCKFELHYKVYKNMCMYNFTTIGTVSHMIVTI